jgi:hypothetical protein
LKIFHNVTWNIFKNSFLLMWTCSLAHMSVLTHSPTSVVPLNLNRNGHVRKQNMPKVFIHIDVKNHCDLKWVESEKLKRGWN